jgi:putative dimethyl sulfoxide reductase chaperone
MWYAPLRFAMPFFPCVAESPFSCFCQPKPEPWRYEHAQPPRYLFLLQNTFYPQKRELRMSRDAVTPQEMAEVAEQRSTVYAFLSSIFTVLPDHRFVERLTDGQMSTLLDALSVEDIPFEIETGIRLIREYLTSIQTVPADQVETDLAVERARLLRGIKPGYGPPPPYESVYRGTGETAVSQTMLEVQRAFAAAGASVPESAHEPVDYIGLELDLMRYLASKEAQAWRAGQEDQALAWLGKQKTFLTDHLVLWVPQFSELMAEQASLGFYQGIARITKGFVISDYERIVDWVE